MLIKEYRIPLPLTLEEYRIAQLYMIQKKSREESEGEGSGVEIIQNHPYTEGPHGSGQYTYKIFHLGRHIPNWFRSIAPRNAFEVHEEAWNAYPYTKTRFSVPFVEKFKLEVDTLFQPDSGTQENIFQLTGAELRQREVDIIDIVNDSLSGSDYKEAEDPGLFVSEKTGRGPLKSDWIQNPDGGVIMCAYKLIKVEFRYWGLQSKIERFIHDYGLRRVMLRAHCQAWTWQDEWVGLTMKDIRRLEKETQIILQQKLGRELPDAGVEDEEQEECVEEETKQITLEESWSTAIAEGNPPSSEMPRKKGEDTSTAARVSGSTGGGQCSPECNHRKMQQGNRRYSRRWPTQTSFGQVPSGTTLTSASHLSPERRDSDDDAFFACAMETIALPSDDSDAEYFDAPESMKNETSDDEEEPVELPAKQAQVETKSAATSSLPPSSLPVPTAPSLVDEHLLSPFQEQLPILGTPDSTYSLPFPSSHSPQVLLLVLHGGGVLHSGLDGITKDIDIQNFSQIANDIMKVHYQYALNQVSIRLVRCPNICAKALELLCRINPVQINAKDCSGLLPVYGAAQSSFLAAGERTESASIRRRVTDSLPLNVIALLGSECPTYPPAKLEVCKAANQVYQEFLNSEEGRYFNGQVCLVTDCLGSILAYDILTSSSASRSRSQSPSSHSSPITDSSPPPPLFHQESLPTRTRVTVPLTRPTPSKSTTPHRKDSAPMLKESLRPVLVEVNSSESSEDLGFVFDVASVFSFGSPLGLILASRKLKKYSTSLPRPKSTSFYNLFYSVDPLSSRIEPLLDPLFANIQPIFVPLYHRYPTGDQTSTGLRTTVAQFPHLFSSSFQLTLPLSQGYPRKAASIECLAISSDDEKHSGKQRDEERFMGLKPFCDWWGQERVDYCLESPPGLENFDVLPNTAYAQIVQSRYWEAKELVSFIIRQALIGLGAGTSDFQTPCANCVPFIPPTSTVKWAKKKTSIRIQHMSPNHRASDMVIACLSAQEATLTAKFNYGPLDVASLRGEMVDVYVLKEKGVTEGGAHGAMASSSGAKSRRKEWQYIDSISTDKHGKVVYSLTPEPPLPEGLYPITFLVKGDHTIAYSNLFVIPPQTEAVVFSIDGAFSSNFSLSAKDMKLKEGSVEVARLWQSLGYLIIYITGRPDIQKQYVMSWLGTHGFPLGVVAFSDTLSADSSSIKRLYLARLIKEARVILYAAYGSQRHLGVYRELGLQPNQIFIHGKGGAKRSRGKQDENCQYLSDGFEGHLMELRDNLPRPAAVDVRQSFDTAHFCPTGVAGGGSQMYGSSPKRKKRAPHYHHRNSHAPDSDH